MRYSYLLLIRIISYFKYCIDKVTVINAFQIQVCVTHCLHSVPLDLLYEYILLIGWTWILAFTKVIGGYYLLFKPVEFNNLLK